MERRPSMAEWLAERFIPGVRVGELVAVERRAFRAYGYEAARILRGKFIEDMLPGVCRSHKSGRIVIREEATRVLLHHDLPLLAFAVDSGEEPGGLYDFVDAPRIAQAFGESFVVAPKSALDSPCDLLALERACGEDDDLRYWAPRRVGDILFNYWD